MILIEGRYVFCLMCKSTITYDSCYLLNIVLHNGSCTMITNGYLIPQSSCVCFVHGKVKNLLLVSEVICYQTAKV